eukprot:Rmarinus@m.29141
MAGGRSKSSTRKSPKTSSSLRIDPLTRGGSDLGRSSEPLPHGSGRHAPQRNQTLSGPIDVDFADLGPNRKDSLPQLSILSNGSGSKSEDDHRSNRFGKGRPYSAPHARVLLCKSICKDVGSQTDIRLPVSDSRGLNSSCCVRGSLVGKGASGRVYVCLNNETGELLAEKVVDLYDAGPKESESVIRNLEREIKLLSSMRHPNVIGYRGIERRDEELSIYMDYCPGGSIQQLYKQFGGLTENVVRKYTFQILCGLKYLHDHHVIHRDIKGANILVETSGLVRLTDFGASAHMDLLTMTSGVKGTPMFMAPEVVRENHYGKPADIWSLGCTVVEMLSASLPYSEFQTPMAALFHIGTKGHPPRFDSVRLSPEAVSFLDLCFQLHPDKRPTAEALLSHPFLRADTPLPLQRHRHAQPVSARRRPPSGRRRDRPDERGISTTSQSRHVRSRPGIASATLDTTSNGTYTHGEASDSLTTTTPTQSSREIHRRSSEIPRVHEPPPIRLSSSERLPPISGKRKSRPAPLLPPAEPTEAFLGSSTPSHGRDVDEAGGSEEGGRAEARPRGAHPHSTPIPSRPLPSTFTTASAREMPSSPTTPTTPTVGSLRGEQDRAEGSHGSDGSGRGSRRGTKTLAAPQESASPGKASSGSSRRRSHVSSRRRSGSRRRSSREKEKSGSPSQSKQDLAASIQTLEELERQLMETRFVLRCEMSNRNGEVDATRFTRTEEAVWASLAFLRRLPELGAAVESTPGILFQEFLAVGLRSQAGTPENDVDANEGGTPSADGADPVSAGPDPPQSDHHLPADAAGVLAVAGGGVGRSVRLRRLGRLLDDRLPPEVTAQAVADAHAMQQMVRIKIEDDKDLEQVLSTLRQCASCLEGIRREADDRGVAPHELATMLTSGSWRAKVPRRSLSGSTAPTNVETSDAPVSRDNPHFPPSAKSRGKGSGQCASTGGESTTDPDTSEHTPAAAARAPSASHQRPRTAVDSLGVAQQHSSPGQGGHEDGEEETYAHTRSEFDTATPPTSTQGQLRGQSSSHRRSLASVVVTEAMADPDADLEEVPEAPDAAARVTTPNLAPEAEGLGDLSLRSVSTPVTPMHPAMRVAQSPSPVQTALQPKPGSAHGSAPPTPQTPMTGRTHVRGSRRFERPTTDYTSNDEDLETSDYGTGLSDDEGLSRLGTAGSASGRMVGVKASAACSPTRMGPHPPVLEDRNVDPEILERFGGQPETIAEIGRHEGGVRCLTYCEALYSIISGGTDSHLRVCRVDVENGDFHQTLQGHTGDVTCVCLGSSGSEGPRSMVVSGSADTTVRVWDPRIGNSCTACFSGHKSTVTGVAMDEFRIWSASEDGTCRVYDVRVGKCLKILKQHGESITCLIPIRNNAGYSVATASKDQSVKLWDSTGRMRSTLRGHLGGLTCLTVVGSGEKRIASAARDNAIKLWDISETGPGLLKTYHHSRVHALSSSPLPTALASGGNDATVRLWDMESGRGMYSMTGHSKAVIRLLHLGPVLVSASLDRTVRLWDVSPSSYFPLCTLHHTRAVTCLGQASPTGDVLSTGARDGAVRVFKFKPATAAAS